MSQELESVSTSTELQSLSMCLKPLKVSVRLLGGSSLARPLG